MGEKDPHTLLLFFRDNPLLLRSSASGPAKMMLE